MALVNWNAAIAYAKLVSIAYTVEPGADYTNQQIAAIKAAGYDYVTTIYGNELATDYNPHLGETVSYGFLATSPAGELVAAIRGTDTLYEWIHDAAFLFVPNPIHSGGGMTEDGFTAIYRSLRAGKDPNGPAAISEITTLVGGDQIQWVTITGHSLGAALATLLALDVSLNAGAKSTQAYTYASPRVGELMFQHTYDSMLPNTYRLHHRSDIVPKTPLFPYIHVGSDIELVSPFQGVNGTLACWHSLDTYLWLMDQQNGGNTLKVDLQCQGPQYAGPK
jgi:predicted lipase